MDFIKLLREKRSQVKSQIDDLLAAAQSESRTALTAEEESQFRAAKDEIDALDARIAELEALEAREAAAAEEARRREGEEGAAGGGIVRVRREEMTYRKGGQFSYFRDLAHAHAPGGGDNEASARLLRHRQEMDVEMRANMNRTDGTGGEFVPPLWLMEQYVPLARAGRVTADLCRKLPLPTGTDSINLPKVNTGTATAEQNDGSSVQKTDMTTGSVSAAVTTIAGQQVFAMQLLDQSPLNFDEVVFADLLADLAVKVDTYVLTKASVGIFAIAGTNSVSYTDASPTVAELYPKVADAVQQIASNRFLPAQAIVMHPRRWAWHLAALDSSQRPLIVPNTQGPTNAFAGFTDVRAEGSVGTLQGLPVYVDANIPTNLGAGTNEDEIAIARFDDLFLYEGSVRTRVLFETDADTLSVRLQVWEYLAFLAGRYPKSISKITGSGLVAPAF